MTQAPSLGRPEPASSRVFGVVRANGSALTDRRRDNKLLILCVLEEDQLGHTGAR